MQSCTANRLWNKASRAEPFATGCSGFLLACFPEKTLTGGSSISRSRWLYRMHPYCLEGREFCMPSAPKCLEDVVVLTWFPFLQLYHSFLAYSTFWKGVDPSQLLRFNIPPSKTYTPSSCCESWNVRALWLALVISTLMLEVEMTRDYPKQARDHPKENNGDSIVDKETRKEEPCTGQTILPMVHKQ